MTGVVKCHGYQCVDRKRERVSWQQRMYEKLGLLFFLFVRPSWMVMRFSAEARDGSVNDPIADSAHVFHVMSALSTSILSNYLLFHRGKCMAPSGGVHVIEK